MTAGLHLAPELTLPLDAITETFALLAVRRAGKSNAAVVMAEEMYDNGLPWVAVDPKGDWWGIRAAGDGKAPGLSVLVFGGLHGDVPLEPTAGKLVADLIVDERITCVLDVSEMSTPDMRRFLTAFAVRLYARNTEPLHLFCEEADEYIPQMVRGGGELPSLVGAFEKLIKRGGFKGIGVTLITQRSASLNKDVLTQVGTLIPMRTPSPQDRKAIEAWVNVHDAGKEAVDELPMLDSGEAWVFSPQWLRTMVKIKFRRRRTFDSGATPKVGGKPRPPANLADVDVAAITAAMKETIEKQKASDPKLLQKRITELERELVKKTPVPEPVIERVEVPVLDDKDRQSLGSLLGELRVVQRQIEEDIIGRLDNQLAAVRKATPAPRVRPTVVSRERPLGPKVPIPDTDIELRKGARRMVEALGRMAPLRLTKSQWGMTAQLAAKGGTWNAYMGDLRRAGLIDENEIGFTLTEAGFDYIGGRPEPMTPDELQAHYLRILRAGAAKMLQAVMDAYPGGLTKEEIADQAELTYPGGTYNAYHGDLRRNGLIEDHDDVWVATEILMHGANA